MSNTHVFNLANKQAKREKRDKESLSHDIWCITAPISLISMDCGEP